MKFILFILPMACIASEYFYFEYKLSLARKQRMIASSQYIALRERYKKLSNNKLNYNVKEDTNLSIKFSTPIYRFGITKPNISLYIAPIYYSQNIKYINVPMEVQILDVADLNYETWFYVALPIDNLINSRGWINKNDFSNLYSPFKTISKF